MQSVAPHQEHHGNSTKRSSQILGSMEGAELAILESQRQHAHTVLKSSIATGVRQEINGIPTARKMSAKQPEIYRRFAKRRRCGLARVQTTRPAVIGNLPRLLSLPFLQLHG